MKVYQIHEYGGSWEDSYDYIRFTYLDPLKAQSKKEELEAQELIDRMCDSCPLNYCPDDCDGDCKNCNETTRIIRAEKYCNRCDVEKVECKEKDEYYHRCKNKSVHYDDSSFEIKEVDVIE